MYKHLSLIEDGPLRATIQVVRRYLDSEGTRYISLEADSPELKIRNEIDWREQKIFLKTLFLWIFTRMRQPTRFSMEMSRVRRIIIRRGILHGLKCAIINGWMWRKTAMA